MMADLRKAGLAMLAAALLAAPGPAFGQEFLKGMILSHQDNRIILRTSAGDRTVTLTPDTKVQGTQGAGVLRRERRPATELMRGLAVEVSGTSSAEDLVADTVTFKTSDLKTARQIQAGLSETETNVAANKAAIAEQEARLNNVANLVAAGRAKVFFKVGRDEISSEGKLELQGIAAQAKAITSGYRLAVVGRADPTGNAAANKRLSERRAAAVKAYLLEHCGVLPGQFVPDTALGDSVIANDPDPPRNDAEARRVSVTIMVSKANEAG